MRAPTLRAIATAARPTPPVAEWISTCWPADSRATWCRAYHAVTKATGTVAAWTMVSPSGTGTNRSREVRT